MRTQARPKRLSPRAVTVTFKVSPDLAQLLDALPNRSDFIRVAVRAQLDEVCPTCQGTGRVSPRVLPDAADRA